MPSFKVFTRTRLYVNITTFFHRYDNAIDRASMRALASACNGDWASTPNIQAMWMVVLVPMTNN